jgi:hypothetical protein
VKKLLLIVVVVALALTVIVPLAAAKPGGGNKHGHFKFNAVGKVTTALDTTTATETSAGTMVIMVKAGTRTVRPKRTDITFDVATDVKVWLLTEDGAVAKTIDAVAAGDWVKVRGTVTVVKDASGKVVSRTYAIKNLKYKDLTPEEVTPPVTPTP